MKCLGLDISYTRTGIVLLESRDEGNISSIALLDFLAMKFPPAEKRFAKAYAAISSELAPGRRPLFNNIDLAVIEDPIYGVINRKTDMIIPTSTIKLAQLAAVFKIFLEIRNLPYLTVSPTAVKRFITGRGDAEKVQVASEIKRRYAISFEKDPGSDLADATALALWGILTKGGK